MLVHFNAHGVHAQSGTDQVLPMPVEPVKGQIFVTERVKPVLSMLTIWIRQMAEGSLLIGESREDAGWLQSPKGVP